jgi:Fe-S-cluster containining protein
MARLIQIQQDVQSRVESIAALHGNWPCRKGCDDCCRNLAREPRVSDEEWALISSALQALPAEVAEAAHQRMRQPFERICPLLDRDAGACLIYEARPVVCRAYGFYAERGDVLGCGRIETVARETSEIIWGNHAALMTRLEELGNASRFSKLSARDTVQSSPNGPLPRAPFRRKDSSSD